ncbi:glycosyltransferase [Arthrobacter sp. FW306-2-2C-D06B]|uniref:glycosyltransferase n=1 Tax=Arthrobacter sp. FW306-2-2C-D06B TaxID=2879618 RepID=UPI001F16F87D|nr:glycosyltransferase [Arthrobacter sp. FW306-2-2C-D06B]UKA57998.1 glycosyltransferase [Arthrobacter sp. FW306-2-2C-D06B]
MPGLIVHEWIEQHGGAEQVLTKLADYLPLADILCLWNDDPKRFRERHVTESILARTPFRNHKAAALPIMPFVWRKVDTEPYDWAMISTHLFAHHVRLSGGSKTSMKFAYVHTPARYIWAPELDSRGRSLPVRMLSVPLRRLDASRAKELTKVAANSQFVSRRIETTWERESTVIYPPVSVERIKSVERWRDHLNVAEEKVFDGLPDEFVLGASRLVMYKMLDHVIRVGKRAQLPVVIVGDGPDLPRLKTIANEEKIECYFVGSVSDRLLYSLFQSCSVYVFPPVEDFGIIPVEAMAAGAPVIANRRGGASESVVHGVTGALTSFSSNSEIDEALRLAAKCRTSDSLQRAEDFSEARFRRELGSWAPEVFGTSSVGK